MVGEYQQDDVKSLLPKLQKYGIDFPNEINLSPFMIAVSHGAGQIADYLVENGAKINVTDNFGRNPLQMAILKAHLDNAYKQKVLNRFYSILKGESIRIKVDNRLIKIDSHQAEFLMLNFMIAVLRSHLISQTKQPMTRHMMHSQNPTFQTADFAKFFDGLSEYVIPGYRRQRPYLSSILAKNEVNRDEKYNKKLFVRLQMGMYLPNPLLEILIDDEWVNLYDLIDIDEIEKNARYRQGFIGLIKDYRRHLSGKPDMKIDPDNYWNKV